MTQPSCPLSSADHKPGRHPAHASEHDHFAATPLPDPRSPLPDPRPPLPLAALHDALDILAAEWETDL
jgi:hypothetical protein